MLTLVVLATFAFAMLSAATWVLRIMFKVFGWTMQLVFGVMFLPLWIIAAVIGGLAWAAEIAVPIIIVALIVSLLVPEQ